MFLEPITKCYHRQDAGKLSKAQRKNLKRNEKKAAERSTEKMSVASSELISEADLSNVEFDMGIPSIEEETIFTHVQDDCVQVPPAFSP